MFSTQVNKCSSIIEQKRVYKRFDFKIGAFKVAQMVNKIWGNFCTKIYHQENSKLAQTGHTLPITDRLPEAFYIN